MRELNISAEAYEQMKAVDIRTVDPATVPDIHEIQVDSTLPGHPCKPSASAGRANPGGRPTDEGQSLRLPLRRHPGQNLLRRHTAPPDCFGGLPGTF